MTRAEADSGPLVARLTAAGWEGVCIPLLERVHTGVALGESSPDWLLLTSAAAVVPDVAKVTPRRVAAVGEATAATLRALGLTVDVVGTAGGEALVEAMGPLAGLRVLWPRAEEVAEETVAALRDSGAVLSEAVVYRNVPAEGVAEKLAAAWPVDAVTLLSPSAARRFAEASRGLGPVPIVVLGETTAEEAGRCGLVVTVAATPTLEALVAALPR